MRSTTPEMRHTLDRLCAAGIRYKQTSDFQIKVGPYNFYPGRGTIYLDSETKARPERGLDNFIKIIARLRERTGSTSSSDRSFAEDKPSERKLWNANCGTERARKRVCALTPVRSSQPIGKPAFLRRSKSGSEAIARCLRTLPRRRPSVRTQPASCWWRDTLPHLSVDVNMLAPGRAKILSERHQTRYAPGPWAHLKP